MNRTHDSIRLYGSIICVIAIISIIVGYAYYQYKYEQSLPDNCTVDNLRHRMNQLDIIAALPIPTSRYGTPNSILISHNLQSILPIRGCNKSTNDALEMTEYTLRKLDFVQYFEWREILQNEIKKMENKRG